MLPQKSPNKWSCLPTAAAMALEIEVSTVIGWIGHDGSEITHAGMPEPLNRRGFHPQELIEMCLCDNIAVTPIDLFPCAVSSTRVPGVKMFDIRNEDGPTRFTRHLFNSKGWIDARTRTGLGHALAYEGAKTFATIGEPTQGHTFNIQSLEELEGFGLMPVTLFRLDPINEV